MIIVFLGPPGVGKGTQCGRLGSHLRLPHISTGDLFREAIQQQTELGQEAGQYIDNGQLVPDELVVKLVSQRLDQADCEQGCLLDGFPRTIEQVHELDRQLSARNRAVDLAIVLSVPREELERRMLKRAEIEDRSDDTPETIAKRMAVYEETTAPLIEYYESHNQLKRVDGIGSPDAVFTRILEALGDTRHGS